MDIELEYVKLPITNLTHRYLFRIKVKGLIETCWEYKEVGIDLLCNSNGQFKRDMDLLLDQSGVAKTIEASGYKVKSVNLVDMTYRLN